MRQDSQRRKQWLSSATSTSWEETLRYASPLKASTDALPGKVGLITEWVQQQKGTSSNGSTTAETFSYSYDKAGRLTGSLRYVGTSSSSVNTLTEQGITYDKSGNLLTLDRYDSSSGTTPAESLSYGYTGPRRNSWNYDTHSNVTHDDDSGLNIEWNVLDLPRTITMSDSVATASTQRSYLADGSLAQVSDGTTTRLYLGDMVFNKASNGTVTLESAGWDGGRLLPGTGIDKVLYTVKDHLGNVRVVRDGSGAVRQRFDYYPYGTASRVWTASSTTDSSEKRYRFGGKEIAGSSLTDLAGYGSAPGTPYLDFGARLYSPRTATWLSPDPMMEKYYGVSPYEYCISNPLLFIDPNGMDWYTINSNGDVVSIETRENEFFDMLFLSFEMGPPDFTRSIKIKDRSILKSMSNAQYVPNSASIKDLRNIFFFVSDSFMEQEWGLYSDGESYAIVTSHSHNHVVSPFENTKSKLHSHSDTAANDKAEYESMGYWFRNAKDFSETGKLLNKNADWYEATSIPNDYYNYEKTSIPSQVYFPISGHVYQLRKYNLPTLIETRHRK